MKWLLHMLRLSLLTGICVVLIYGCSSSSRQVNVSAGEYYSEDEYEMLSNKEKNKYCSVLAKELSGLDKNAEEKKQELSTTKDKIEKLKSEIGPVERELLRTESDIRTLERQIEMFQSLPQKWVIQPGECLWIIAGHEEIYADPVKWPRLYRRNMDKIEDPEWIWPDTVLVIPREWPGQHVIRQDEYLSLIAGYWEIYGNPLEWPKLFEANKDKINDPDLVHPSQVLTVPR